MIVEKEIKDIEVPMFYQGDKYTGDYLGAILLNQLKNTKLSHQER